MARRWMRKLLLKEAQAEQETFPLDRPNSWVKYRVTLYSPQHMRLGKKFLEEFERQIHNLDCSPIRVSINYDI